MFLRSVSTVCRGVHPLAVRRVAPPAFCRRALASRASSSFPMPKLEVEEKKDETVPQWIQTFNERMSKDVMVTIPLFLAVRNGTWYGLAFIYGQYFSFGPEFAAAYLMVKLTGKFRRPIDVALAAILSKTFPMLSQIKVSSLFSPPPQDEAVKGTMLGKAMAWVQGPMDKYGFSFYLSCKLTSFASIAGTAAAIKYGVDISSALTYFGVPEIVQDASAAFGVATMTNIVLIPAHFALVSALVPTVGEYVKSARGSDNSSK